MVSSKRYVDIPTETKEMSIPKVIELPFTKEVKGIYVTTVRSFRPGDKEWEESLKRYAFINGYVEG